MFVTMNFAARNADRPRRLNPIAMMAMKWIRRAGLLIPHLTPEGQAEADELEHAIQHCLDNLPVEFRAVVVLADLQGLDYSEVAAALRAPLGTVKSRLARARIRLQECLQGFAELLPAAFRLNEERS